MADQLDMTNRDPNQMNQHIQVMFDDVLAEPEGAHSADCVWTNSYKCFTCGTGCCYKLLTFICGLPMALSWGCMFACITFYEVWCMTPMIRAINILLHSIRRLYSILLSACLAPLMETMGMMFSRIHVTSSTGEPPQPLGVIASGDNRNVKSFK